MKTVLVTGSCGFIGSWCANLLHKRGYDVVGYDNLDGGVRENLSPEIVFWRGDILDTAMLNQVFALNRPEIVIHAAAFAAEGLSHFVRRHCITNVAVGTANLINASINFGCVEHFTLFSSIAVMGDSAPPFTEDMPLNPIDVYAASKALCEADVKAAHALWGLPYNIWRPHNVVGVAQNLNDGYRNFAAICFRAILENRPIPIFSDGRQTRAFSPVLDVVEPVLAAIERPASHNKTFNIGADRPVRVIELAQMISDAMGVPLRVEHLPPRHEAIHAFSNHDRAKLYFADVMNRVTLEEELARVAKWAKTQTLRVPKRFDAIEIEKGLPAVWNRPT